MAAIIHLLWLVLMLSWSLEGVNYQTFPCVSFHGQTLANHSYVNLNEVGRPEDGGEGVQCITDLDTCCTNTDGPHRGDWYFPDGTRLPFSGDYEPFSYRGYIYENRGPQRVALHRRNNAHTLVGIYRCDIPTIAVHDDSDRSVRATVYVGLYTSGGMFHILAMRTYNC